MHRLLVGNFLADEHRVVDLYDLISRNQASTLCWAIADDILHADGILTDGKLNADAGERTLQVVGGYLYILGSDVGGMRIELRQDLRHSFLNKVIHVDSVNIHIVDVMEQIVEFAAIRIDDAQPVAREMIGIECAD